MTRNISLGLHVFYIICSLGVFSLGRCNSIPIEELTEPPKLDLSTPTLHCPDPTSDCHIKCRFTHTTIYELVPDSCKWIYKPDEFAPGIIVSTPGCTKLDGGDDLLLMDLVHPGTYSGYYVCHAEYTSSSAEPQEVNGYIQMNDKGVEIPGDCLETSDCKTYHATCSSGSCTCSSPYNYIFSLVDNEGYGHYISCVEDGIYPEPASSCKPTSWSVIVAAMVLLGVWGSRS